MGTVRQARRALRRGDVDGALVDMWNAVEPLRLRGDRSGLEEVAGMAASVVRHGDGSQAREAERLLEEVRRTIDPDALRPAAVAVGAHAPVALERREAREGREVPEEWDDVDWGDVEVGPDVPDSEPTGPRIGPLVWALIVAAFVIFNIVSGLLRE